MYLTGVRYCALISCAYRHPIRRVCLVGRSRRSGACPGYRPRPTQAPPRCRTASCAHFYIDDWRGRCRLGLRWTDRAGTCPGYLRRHRLPQPKVGTCSLSSCSFWYRSVDGRYRCALGLSRRSGQDCPRYERKRRP